MPISCMMQCAACMRCPANEVDEVPVALPLVMAAAPRLSTLELLARWGPHAAPLLAALPALQEHRRVLATGVMAVEERFRACG